MEWYQYTQMDQWYKIESLEVDSFINSHLIYDKGVTVISVGKLWSLKLILPGQLDIHIRWKKNLDPNSHHLQKKQFQINHAPKSERQSNKVSKEENIGEHIHDLEAGKYFLRHKKNTNHKGKGW